MDVLRSELVLVRMQFLIYAISLLLCLSEKSVGWSVGREQTKHFVIAERYNMFYIRRKIHVDVKRRKSRVVEEEKKNVEGETSSYIYV